MIGVLWYCYNSFIILFFIFMDMYIVGECEFKFGRGILSGRIIEKLSFSLYESERVIKIGL